MEIGRLLVGGNDAVKMDWVQAIDPAQRAAGSRELPGNAPQSLYNSRVDIPRPRSAATCDRQCSHPARWASTCFVWAGESAPRANAANCPASGWMSAAIPGPSG